MTRLRYIKSVLFVALFFTMLIGCTSHITVDEKGRTVAHHFGYVRIIKPPFLNNNDTMNVTAVRVLGFSIENGFTLGYTENEIISIPTDCRLMVIVQNKQQLELLVDQLHDLQGEKICAAVTPKE